MRNFIIVLGLVVLASCGVGTSQKDSKTDTTAVFNADTLSGTKVDSVKTNSIKTDSVNVK